MLLYTSPAHSIIGDGVAGLAQVNYLTQILAENVRRYHQLKQMIAFSKSHEDYLEACQSGLGKLHGAFEGPSLERPEAFKGPGQGSSGLKVCHSPLRKHSQKQGSPYAEVS